MCSRLMAAIFFRADVSPALAVTLFVCLEMSGNNTVMVRRVCQEMPVKEQSGRRRKLGWAQAHPGFFTASAFNNIHTEHQRGTMK